MTSDTPLTSLENVEVHFEDASMLDRVFSRENRVAKAVDGVTLDIEEKEVVALVGSVDNLARHFPSGDDNRLLEFDVETDNDDRFAEPTANFDDRYTGTLAHVSAHWAHWSEEPSLSSMSSRRNVRRLSGRRKLHMAETRRAKLARRHMVF